MAFFLSGQHSLRKHCGDVSGKTRQHRNQTLGRGEAALPASRGFVISDSRVWPKQESGEKVSRSGEEGGPKLKQQKKFLTENQGKCG